MRKVHALTAAAVVAAFGAGVIYSQSGAQAAGTLTGADIAEIEQLYARYNQGLDFKDKELFLSAFADDAVYTTGAGVAYEGRAGLEEWLAPVMENSSGAPVTHNNTSILITPTADGAKGPRLLDADERGGPRAEARVLGILRGHVRQDGGRLAHQDARLGARLAAGLAVVDSRCPATPP